MAVDLLQGDCRIELRHYPDGFFDSVVTDAPYGLSKEPNAAEVLRHWLVGDDFKATGGGFMGKTWDSFVPGPATWKEIYRVLKPGGHLVTFAGSRTQDLMGLAIRLAGFEIRDGLTWLYGSGFPKNHDVSKAIEEHLAKADDPSMALKAAQWRGWGTALKPAFEPIILARKPFDGTVAENVLEHGVGGLNTDVTRIKAPGEESPSAKRRETARRTGNAPMSIRVASSALAAETQAMGKIGRRGSAEVYATERPNELLGRFPANVLLTHHEDCVLLGTKRVKGSGHAPKNTGPSGMWGKRAGGGGLRDADREERYFTDEEVERWDCTHECPVRALDLQSGLLKSGYSEVVRRNAKTNPVVYGSVKAQEQVGATYGDSGGASRFYYCAKSSRAEREAGLQGNVPCSKCGDLDSKTHDVDGKPVACIRNVHPTVKSLGIMRWLVKLVTPPGGFVLDPFLGSGTTGCASVQEEFHFTGIELQPEYLAIAQARIEHWKGRK